VRFAPAVPLLAIVAACLAAACGGGGSSRPSTPPVPAVVIQTEAGALAVVAYGCEPDLDRMVREVNTTTRIARRQRPGLFAGAPLAGFEIHARTPAASAQRCDGEAACFERFGSRGRLHVWCDGGGLEHESGHALAHAAGLPCADTVLHDGIDFTCRRKVPAAAR